MQTQISNGKITAVTLEDGPQLHLDKPVPVRSAQEVERVVGWMEEHLNLDGVESEPTTEPDRWEPDELKAFIEGRKRHGKQNQLTFLRILAERDGVVTKEVIDEIFEDDDPSWGAYSLGGMIGGLANKINGKGKEKFWKDRKNSDLSHNTYEMKSRYRQALKDAL